MPKTTVLILQYWSKTQIIIWISVYYQKKTTYLTKFYKATHLRVYCIIQDRHICVIHASNLQSHNLKALVCFHFSSEQEDKRVLVHKAMQICVVSFITLWNISPPIHPCMTMWNLGKSYHWTWWMTLTFICQIVLTLNLQLKKYEVIYLI